MRTNLTILAGDESLTGIQFMEFIKKSRELKNGSTLTLKTDLFSNAKMLLLFTPCSNK